MVTESCGLVLDLLPAVLFGVILTLFLVIVELDRAGEAPTRAALHSDLDRERVTGIEPA